MNGLRKWIRCLVFGALLISSSSQADAEIQNLDDSREQEQAGGVDLEALIQFQIQNPNSRIINGFVDTLYPEISMDDSRRGNLLDYINANIEKGDVSPDQPSAKAKLEFAELRQVHGSEGAEHSVVDRINTQLNSKGPSAKTQRVLLEINHELEKNEFPKMWRSANIYRDRVTSNLPNWGAQASSLYENAQAAWKKERQSQIENIILKNFQVSENGRPITQSEVAVEGKEKKVLKRYGDFIRQYEQFVERIDSVMRLGNPIRRDSDEVEFYHRMKVHEKFANRIKKLVNAIDSIDRIFRASSFQDENLEVSKGQKEEVWSALLENWIKLYLLEEEKLFEAENPGSENKKNTLVLLEASITDLEKAIALLERYVENYEGEYSKRIVGLHEKTLESTSIVRQLPLGRTSLGLAAVGAAAGLFWYKYSRPNKLEQQYRSMSGEENSSPCMQIYRMLDNAKPRLVASLPADNNLKIPAPYIVRHRDTHESAGQTFADLFDGPKIFGAERVRWKSLFLPSFSHVSNGNRLKYYSIAEDQIRAIPNRATGKTELYFRHPDMKDLYFSTHEIVENTGRSADAFGLPIPKHSSLAKVLVNDLVSQLTSKFGKKLDMPGFSIEWNKKEHRLIAYSQDGDSQFNIDLVTGELKVSLKKDEQIFHVTHDLLRKLGERRERLAREAEIDLNPFGE